MFCSFSVKSTWNVTQLLFSCTFEDHEFSTYKSILNFQAREGQNFESQVHSDRDGPNLQILLLFWTESLVSIFWATKSNKSMMWFTYYNRAYIVISLTDSRKSHSWTWYQSDEFHYSWIIFKRCPLLYGKQNLFSVNNVVRLILPRSGSLTFWPKIAKTGQILTENVGYLSGRQIFTTRPQQFFALIKCIFKKFGLILLV